MKSRVYTINNDLPKSGQFKSNGVGISGTPLQIGDGFLIALQNGDLVQTDADGNETGRVNCGQALQSGPIQLGSGIIVVSVDGRFSFGRFTLGAGAVMRFFRTTAAALILCVASPFAIAQDDDEKQEGNRGASELPSLADLEKNIPSARELIARERQLDWVVLRKDATGRYPVIVAEDVKGRPQGVEGFKTEGLRKIDVVIPAAGVEEFSIPVSGIEKIVYGEELMLRRADLLLKDGDIETAFELLTIVENRIPKWEKTVPRLQRLLFRDAEIKLSKKRARTRFGAVGRVQSAERRVSWRHGNGRGHHGQTGW